MRHNRILTYVLLSLWSLITMVPIWILLAGSLKPQREIFSSPMALPTEPDLSGYQAAVSGGDFLNMFKNSAIVTLTSIAVTLVVGSMAAYGLAQWRGRTPRFLYFGFVAGIMVPIRLATIEIFHVVDLIGLVDTIWGLIPVYIAMTIPLAVFVLTDFVKAIPTALFDAASIDGAGEWSTFWRVVIPLIRPALATVAILAVLPIWNDIWFPLILTRSDDQQTVMLGVNQLFGEFNQDWTNILAVLTLAALPVFLMYLILNRQFVKGLTAGAIKQ